MPGSEVPGQEAGKLVSGAVEYFRDMVTTDRRARELADFAGKVVGVYCNFVPEELIYALGAVPVRLCSGDDGSARAGETAFPRDTCSLVKACVGEAVENCELFGRADLLVIPTPCDAKKKLGGVMAAYKPVHMLGLPPSKAGPGAREFWMTQIWELVGKLESLTGRRLTRQGLQEAIELLNRRQSAFRRFLELRKSVPARVTGEEALLVTQASFHDEPTRWTGKLQELCEERAASGITPKPAPRLMLSGAPVLYPNLKLVRAIEEAGAELAIDETCAGTQRLYNPTVVRETSLRKMVEAVAEKCLLPQTCPCFVENADRVNRIGEMVAEYSISGVVYHTLRMCPLFDIEAMQIQRELRRKAIPCLVLSTDYSLEDSAQILTRVEAFVEMVAAAQGNAG